MGPGTGQISRAGLSPVPCCLLGKEGQKTQAGSGWHWPQASNVSKPDVSATILEGSQVLALSALAQICCWHVCLPTPRDAAWPTPWPWALCRPSQKKASHSQPVWAATPGALKAAPYYGPSYPLGLAARIWLSRGRMSRHTEVNALGF